MLFIIKSQDILKKKFWPLILILFLFSMAIGTAGYFAYRSQKHNLKEERWEQLRTIADLKVNQIVNWRKERLGDGAIVLESPFINHHVQQYLRNPKVTEVRQEIFEWMVSLQRKNQYWNILLLDTKGNVHLITHEGNKVIESHEKTLAAEAIQKSKVILSDFYRSETSDAIRLSLLVPISLPKGNGNLPIGILLLRIDPYQFLYPLIQSWPTSSLTSESLLIRREGDEVVFLNELRHRKNTALTFRFPISKERLPAAMAACGKEGIIEGLDYRGVPVLAAIRSIPDAPWFLIAKVDQEEIYALIQTRMRFIASLVGLLIIGAGLGVGLLWRHQWAEFYKRQYRIEAEHRALAQRFVYLTEHANDIILLLDEELKIIEANDRAVESYGYTRDELLQMSLRDIRVPEERSTIDLHMKVVKEKNGSIFETNHQRKDGTRFTVENSIRVIDIDGKAYYESIIRDVSERKKAEQEMATLQEQLRQSQKMEAIGRLAGGIAHDFNNLLTVIEGYSQLSIQGIKEDDPLRLNIEEIRRASGKAADLTRQLLAFSRRQILEMKVLDINVVLRNLDKMLRRVIGEDIELVTVLAEDLGRAKSDPGQIEQVIMNLAVNARDAMPDGGKLTIETANVQLDETYARNHVTVTPGRYVMFSVSDTGVGMTPEVKERVFEPFFTTKERGRGTGLGLSTVYGIVKQSGGNIWTYSEPGKGTTFKIYLPRVDEPLEELKERMEAKELPKGDETILVVEDDEEVRKLAVRILEGQGYRVLEASQGNEALSLCEEHKEPINLMLTDVVMPGMSGRELAERLITFHPEMKILYMSGYTDNAITHQGVLEKGMNYIQKPFTLEGLARKVREVLDKDLNPAV